VLTDPEVDRRFATLVADLNLPAVAADWPQVTDTDAVPSSNDDREVKAAVRPLRLTAAVVVVAMVAIGVFTISSFGLGWVFGLAWFLLIVPAVALASVTLVDGVRRLAGANRSR
jgi:hypothetical protein